MSLVDRARELRATIESLTVSMNNETALNNIELFPLWSNNYEYKINDRVRYEGTLYKCLNSHTSQSTWSPADAHSLWVRVDDPGDEWPEWIQPLGSTDAYSLGAKVSHDGKHWISDYDNNVWEPGVFGWSEELIS